MYTAYKMQSVDVNAKAKQTSVSVCVFKIVVHFDELTLANQTKVNSSKTQCKMENECGNRL